MSSKALGTNTVIAEHYRVSAGQSERVSSVKDLARTGTGREGALWSEERAFFREWLADAEPTLLPNDRRKGPSDGAAKTAIIETRLPRSLAEAAQLVARSRRVSLLAVLASPFVLFLKKYARAGEVLIGTFVHGDASPCPGGNVLPLRVSIDHEASFADLLASVDAAYSAAKKHGRIPYAELAAERTSNGRTNFIRTLCSVNDQAASDVPLDNHGRTELELELELELDFVVRDSGCVLQIKYDQTLFGEPTLRVLSDCVCHFLEQGLNRLESPLNGIRFPGSAPRAELIGPTLRGDAPSPAFNPVTARVSAIASAMPDALAVVFGEARLTYGELLTWADDVRREALSSVLPGDRVGVVCRDDEAYAAACLAVWLEGCTLVPIDPEYPLARLQFVLSNASVTTLLDSADGEPIDGGPGVVARSLPARSTGQARALAPSHPLRPETAAYILYTSGSTGTPRGAAISHGNLSAFFEAAFALYDVGPSDRWAWLHTVGFDVSMWETWGPLCSGGSLWLVPKWTRRDPVELRQFIEDYSLTILCQAPSAFYEFIRADSAKIAGQERVRYLPGGELVTERDGADTDRRYQAIFVERSYEHPALALRKGDVVVDLGAGVGLASVWFASVVGARCHLLEASSELASLAERNLALHAIDAEVLRDTSASAVSTLLSAHGQGEIGVLRIDLARVDEDVIVGLDSGLWSRVRTVICERGERPEQLRRIRQTLELQGYELELEQNQGPFDQVSAPLIAWRREGAEWTAPCVRHPRRWARTPLRYVVLAGEVLDPARLREWFQKHDDAQPKIVNNYGITETTIYDTYRVFSREDARVPWVATPVGAPYPNMAMRVEDEYNDVVPVGGRGELVLAGGLVGLGYVQREELTRQKFGVGRWHGVAAETPTYKSGDLARVLRDGELVVEGRIDQQFQLRGFRVEPGEVEGVLLGDPEVRSAVVQSYRLGSDAADSLVAYLLPVGERDQLSVSPSRHSDLLARLRTRVSQALPEYMQPAAYVVLAEWPRTASGKLDRKALPAPRSEAPDAATPAPGTELEQSILAIWQEMLALDAIAWDDNFFTIGGHSLLAARICAALEPKLGVRIPLRDFFRVPTPRGLAQVAAALLAKSGPIAPVTNTAVACDPSSREKPFPLTPVQQAYWIGRQNVIGLGDVSTHNYVELDTTKLDVGRFTWALRQVIARHGMLRCVVGADMTQRILLEVPAYEVVTHELESLSDAAREQRLTEIRSRLAYEVRSSDRWPLFAVEVSRLANGLARLHVSGDALAIDGSGWQQVMRDTLHFYRSDSPLPALPLFSFRDYVLALENAKGSADAEVARAYWMSRLPKLPPAPELPTARPLEQVDQRAWKRLTQRISAPRWSRILDQIRAQGVTPSIALAAAFSRVLAHFASRPHFCLNLTLFDRLPLHPDVGQVVGDFTTLLLLEAESRANESFATMARRLQTQFFEDFDHRAVSGVEVLRAISRSEGRAPSASMPIVFTSMLSLDGGSALDDLCEAFGGSLVYGISQTSQVWLDHQVMEQSGCLVWNWDFLENLFHPGFIEEMFETYLRLVEGLAEQSSWCSPVYFDTPAPNGDFNSSAGGSATLVDGFIKHARQASERTALIYRGIRYAYGSLLSGAYGLARELLRAGIVVEEPVIVNCEEPPSQVTAMLAVLLAGGCYVPLPTDVPRARVEEIGRLVRGRLALTDHVGRIEGLQVLSVPDPLLANASCDSLGLPSLSPEQLAYVIFTSGTTGAPKGVSMTHGAAMNTISAMNARFGVGKDDCCLALSAIGFDLSVYDIFGLLGVGGCIAYPERSRRRDPEAWHALCQEAGVTLWNSVPALAQMFADYLRGVGRRLPASLRKVWWSGDWIPVELPSAWRGLAESELEITSLGGATEGGIWSVFYPIHEVEADWASIPYGKSLPGQSIEVLDHELRPRLAWVVGEICIAGASLARDYYGLPEQTRERFVHSKSGVRWYRTGDLGRRLPDGNIEFLGRQDGQVKIRGHRVETAEVEARLLRRDLVAECAVLAKGPAHAKTELVAYVVRSRALGMVVPTNCRVAAPELPKPLVNVPEGLEDRCALIEDLEARARFKGSRPHRSHDGTIRSLAGPVRGEVPRRSSSRRFQLRALPESTFSAWLGALAAFDRAGERARNYGSAGGLYPVQIYVSVKPGRVDGVPAGSYWFDPEACALCRVSEAWSLRHGSHAAINEQLVNESAIAVYLALDLTAIAPIYGEHSLRYATLEAGAITQLLESHGAAHGVGMCQLGAVASDAVAETCQLGAEHVLLHAAVAGLAELHDAGMARPSQSDDMRVRALLERVSALSENEAELLERAILGGPPAVASCERDAKSNGAQRSSYGYR